VTGRAAWRWIKQVKCSFVDPRRAMVVVRCGLAVASLGRTPQRAAANPAPDRCNPRDMFDRPYLPAVGLIESRGFPTGHGGFL